MITHISEYELKKKDGRGGGVSIQRGASEGRFMLFLIQASFPHVLSSLSNVSCYRSGNAAVRESSGCFSSDTSENI